jgi:TonB-like protein
MIRSMLKWLSVLLLVAIAFGVLQAQDKHAKQFEKLVAGTDPLILDSERIYRPKEVSQPAAVTVKPEPLYTDKARQKKTEGTVLIRAVFKSTGEVRVLSVIKRLPNGLTEQALDGASKIQFRPALINGTPVSQIILLQYNFNRH